MKMNSYEIIQNHLIGAHSLTEFVYRFNENNSETSPSLYYLLPVLPIVFNEKSRRAIMDRRLSESSFYKVISDDQFLFEGLNERIRKMTKQTLMSLNFAQQLNLLEIDKKTGLIKVKEYDSAIRQRAKFKPDYRSIIQTSHRLGSWFSNFSIPQLMYYLKISA